MAENNVKFPSVPATKASESAHPELWRGFTGTDDFIRAGQAIPDTSGHGNHGVVCESKGGE